MARSNTKTINFKISVNLKYDCHYYIFKQSIFYYIIKPNDIETCCERGNCMDSNFGITLRRIRKAKHKSIDYVSGHFISKSQVSRFERGESEITFTSLYSILNLLNISFDEFLNIHCKYQSKSEQFSVLIKNIKTCINVEKEEDFNTIFNRFCLSSFTHIEIIVIKSLLSRVNSSIFLSTDEVEELAEYFFSIDYWGCYELLLLENCEHSLNYTSCYYFTNEVIHEFEDNELYYKNKKLVINVAINCLIRSVELGEYRNCLSLIEVINKLLDSELYFYEKTVFLFALGYFESRRNNSNGNNKMKDAIVIFKKLGDQFSLIYYTNLYKKINNSRTCI